MDYYQLQALDAVVKQAGFQRAAERLLITQSAVSQRIKALETTAGQPLLIRSVPPVPTDLGKKYLSIFAQMEALFKELEPKMPLGRIKIPVACNTESFQLWFNRCIIDFGKEKGVLFEISLADQDQTLALLKEAQVLGCVSSESGPIHGCYSYPLQPITYVCVASPEFIKRFELNRDLKSKLPSAPTIIYGSMDLIHDKFLCQVFRTKRVPPYVAHVIPSISGILENVNMGSAYAVLPEEMVQDLVRKGELIQLFPSQRLKIPLFWHVVQTEIPLLKAFTNKILGMKGRDSKERGLASSIQAARES